MVGDEDLRVVAEGCLIGAISALCWIRSKEQVLVGC